jgi:hypothetical protein
VRLPRDWLGPRDELVPFGPRATSVEAKQAPSSGKQPPPSAKQAPPSAADWLPGAGDLPPDAEEPPPSAEDFWGERSAAIHDALRAPVAAAGGTSVRAPAPRHRLVAATAAGVAIAAVAVFVLVFTLPGPGGSRQPGAGSKVALAAVFSDGLSRILQLGFERIDLSGARHSVARHAVRQVRRSPYSPKSNHQTGPPSQPSVSSAHVVAEGAPATAASSNSYHRASTDTNSGSPQAYTAPPSSPAPPPPASQPVSSSATVSPTGESGALGPVQSPNG